MDASSESPIAIWTQVSAWLTSHGFQVEEIQAGRRSLLFSGTAGQVAGAFHTSIHYYFVNGQTHRANVSDPEIPEALSQVVLGVASLHDFQSHPALASPENTIPIAPEYTQRQQPLSCAFGDFATIYDVNPLYTNNVDGTGVSVAVVARSNINIADVQAFRSTFGLPANNPTVIVNGTDPGNLVSGGEQFESHARCRMGRRRCQECGGQVCRVWLDRRPTASLSRRSIL